MTAVWFTYESKLKLTKRLSKVIVNSVYYQQNILYPIFEEETPDLYEKKHQ